MRSGQDDGQENEGFVGIYNAYLEYLQSRYEEGDAEDQEQLYNIFSDLVNEAKQSNALTQEQLGVLQGMPADYHPGAIIPDLHNQVIQQLREVPSEESNAMIERMEEDLQTLRRVAQEQKRLGHERDSIIGVVSELTPKKLNEMKMPQIIATQNLIKKALQVERPLTEADSRKVTMLEAKQEMITRHLKGLQAINKTSEYLGKASIKPKK